MSGWLKRLDSARHSNRSAQMATTMSLVGLLLVVLSSAGVAGQNANPVVYYACVNHTTHAWQYSTATATCTAGFVKEHWNQAGPAGPQGPQGPSNGFHASSDGISMGGTIVSLTIPAGSYLIYAKGVPYFDNKSTTARSDAMHCDLFDTAGSIIDSTFAVLILGTDKLGNVFSDESVSMMAPTVTAGGTISFNCLDNLGVGIMFRNQLTAIQLGSVTGKPAMAPHQSNTSDRP